MKFSEIFSFIIIHVCTKNHEFQTDIKENFFHGLLILPQKLKKKFLVNTPILTAYKVQKILRINHRKNL